MEEAITDYKNLWVNKIRIESLLYNKLNLYITMI